MKVVCV